MKTEDTEALGELNQAGPKPDPVDQLVRTARTITMVHNTTA